MGLPGHFVIEIKTEIVDRSFVRKIKLLNQTGLTGCSAAFYFDNKHENRKYLSQKDVDKSIECERIYFRNLLVDTADYADGIYKIVKITHGGEIKFFKYEDMPEEDKDLYS